MLKLRIALAIAAIAIAANGITYKPFVRGFLHRGEPVASQEFVGATWQDGDEMAFAGLRLRTMDLVTGP